MALLDKLQLLLERRRAEALHRFPTLTQSLFERPTADEENLIAQLFRQPQSDVRYLLAKNRLHNSRFEQRRSEVDSAARVRRYCEGFQIPQREEFLDLVNTDSRSRIVASFHFGDFLYGSASLFTLESRSRQQRVLSLNSNSSACYSNLSAGLGDGAPVPEYELLHGETDTQDLSRLLRAGNASLLLFCDIPPGLNETMPLKFLGREAYFSVGPAILAIANRVPLLPLINYSKDNQSFIRLGQQIEPDLLRSETIRLAARRITQSLVSFFESTFIAHPEQWRFLSLLPRYFSIPQSYWTNPFSNG